MLRRLLACIALISGLAAIGAPAHASVAQAVSLEAGSGVLSSDTVQDERIECADDSARPSRSDPGKAASPNQRSRQIVRPPVLFGVDRAHE